MVAFLAATLNVIRTVLPVSLLKLLPSAQGTNIGNAIHGQNSIEMIDLVLQQLGQIPFCPSPQFVRFSCNILITDRHLAMPFYLHKD